MLCQDKALSKKLLHYHRIPVPDFVVVRRRQRPRLRKRLGFPVIVKSLTQEASIGISQASVVEDEAHLVERVQFIHESIGTDAIIEQYIDGRELYCGVIGNDRLRTVPVFEMTFGSMAGPTRHIATERVKWSRKYQEKVGIATGPAGTMPDGLIDRIQHLSRRVYRVLELSGYARIDLRLAGDGRVYVLEANPNPQIAKNEDGLAVLEWRVVNPDEQVPLSFRFFLEREDGSALVDRAGLDVPVMVLDDAALPRGEPLIARVIATSIDGSLSGADTVTLTLR